jgi:hypothetical protein
MDAKAELNKVWKDVQASAKEFAALSLSMSSKALEFASEHIKKAQESLKVQAEKLAPEPRKDGNGVVDVKKD